MSWADSDAGYDDVQRSETTYSIAVEDLIIYCRDNVDAVMIELRDAVAESFTQPCELATDQLFKALTAEMQSIQETLQSSLRTQELDKQTQAEVHAALEQMTDQVSYAEGDTQALFCDVDAAMQTLTQTHGHE